MVSSFLTEVGDGVGVPHRASKGLAVHFNVCGQYDGLNVLDAAARKPLKNVRRR